MAIPGLRPLGRNFKTSFQATVAQVARMEESERLKWLN